ncbi:MAG: hypothetical protein ACMXYF_05520 [Candidatus Woesearchaeota archaeon]
MTQRKTLEKILKHANIVRQSGFTFEKPAKVFGPLLMVDQELKEQYRETLPCIPVVNESFFTHLAQLYRQTVPRDSSEIKDAFVWIRDALSHAGFSLKETDPSYIRDEKNPTHVQPITLTSMRNILLQYHATMPGAFFEQLQNHFQEDDIPFQPAQDDIYIFPKDAEHAEFLVRNHIQPARHSWVKLRETIESKGYSQKRYEPALPKLIGKNIQDLQRRKNGWYVRVSAIPSILADVQELTTPVKRPASVQIFSGNTTHTKPLHLDVRGIEYTVPPYIIEQFGRSPHKEAVHDIIGGKTPTSFWRRAILHSLEEQRPVMRITLDPRRNQVLDYSITPKY